MKKILFLIHDLAHGGAEKVLVNLVNNMDQNKFDITVQTLFDFGGHRDSLKPHVHYKTCFKHVIRGNSYLMKIFSPKFLYKHLIDDEYDIIVSYLEGPSARVLAGCTNQKVKKVCWLHIELNDNKAIAKGFCSYKEAMKCYNQYDQLIAVSETVKEAFITSTGMTKNKIQVLYNTNETEKIVKKSMEEVEDIQFNPDIINVCSVAKIVKTKGYDRLVRVHKQLMDEGLKHHIYILGVGEQQQEIQRYIDKNGLSDTFTFVGFRNNPYKYVQKCDLYVCSSLREGFSTAVTEALVVGTPVISTLCSGAYELLGKNNEYGIVVENSEKGIYQGMKMVLENPEMLDNMKKMAKDRGKYFSREKTVQAVEIMLEAL